MRHVQNDENHRATAPQGVMSAPVSTTSASDQGKVVQQTRDEHQYPLEKSYGNVNVDGHGTVWQGDLHGTQVNNYYSAPHPSPDACRVLLESLTFDRMDARRRNVVTALPSTCHWLRDHECFRAWIDPDRMQEHSGFLWIKGKPGSGKSTIMKETLTWAEQHWPEQIVLSYFFNARSPNTLEKSSLGLYRSLVHQLIAACSHLQGPFVSRFLTKVRPGNRVEEWTEPELQNFLVEVVITHQQQPVTVFIDALDEGATDDIRRMINYLERLTQRSIFAQASTRVCLSSRHFPYITIRTGLSLALENQSKHQSDIEAYIKSQLLYDGDNADELQRQVLNRAAGVFLWVVLVIVKLNTLYDRGKSLSVMLQKLDETPKDLHDMFADILSRDREDMEECASLLRWVLFSLRPLTAFELFAAVQQSSCEDVEYNDSPTQKTIMRYLLNCSRGLVEETIADPPDIQFIHETVRDFLLRRVEPCTRASSNKETQVPWTDFHEGHSHLTIAEECVQYLINIGRMNPSVDRIQLPLAEYAAQYWWQHARASKLKCSSKLVTLFQELMMSVSNLSMCYRLYDPDWIDKHASGFDFSDFNKNVSPVYYAVSTGILELVTVLLDHCTDLNAQEGLFSTPLHAAAFRGYKPIVQLLSDKGVDINAQGGYLGNALQAALYSKNITIAQLLLDRGADINAQGGEFGNALQTAAFRGADDIVQLLLDRGADVNAHGGRYGNALQAASFAPSISTAQLLLDRGANINAQGGYFGSPLQAFAFRGIGPMVQFLLDRGADVNVRGGYYYSPLYVGVARGREESVKTLLDNGADSSVTGQAGVSVLHVAAKDSKVAMLRHLLNSGAKVDPQDRMGQTPLICAITGSQKEASRLLVKAQADFTIVDGYGRTAVDWLKVLSTDDELLNHTYCDRNLPANWDSQQVRSTIVSVSTTIFEEQDRRHADLFYRLGHCFAMLNDLQNASFAFQQTFNTWIDFKEKHLTIKCGMCPTHKINEIHFICTVCPDVELCASCVDKLNKGDETYRCRNHDLMKIPPLPGVVASDETKKSWLQDVIKEYSSNGPA